MPRRFRALVGTGSAIVVAARTAAVSRRRPAATICVQVTEDKRVDLARLDAGGDPTGPQPLYAAVALQRHRPTGGAVREWVVGDHIEWTDHRAHRAGDALRLVDEDDVMLGIAPDRPGRADLLARCRIAVATLVGERGARPGTGLDVDPSARRRLFERCQGGLPGRRVLDGAAELALETADAPLRVDEDGEHLLTSRERAARLSSPPSPAADDGHACPSCRLASRRSSDRGLSKDSAVRPARKGPAAQRRRIDPV